MANCPVCNWEMGAGRKYCSVACKQKAYRLRVKEKNLHNSGNVTADVTGNDFGVLLAAINQLVARFDAALAAGGSGSPASSVVLPSRLPAPKPLDDDLPELVIVEAVSDENPAFNMIISAASMMGEGFHDLPLEVLEYAVKKGRLPASLLDGRTAVPAGPKTMVGSGIQFEVNLEDIELDFDLVQVT